VEFHKLPHSTYSISALKHQCAITSIKLESVQLELQLEQYNWTIVIIDIKGNMKVLSKLTFKKFHGFDDATNKLRKSIQN